MPATDALDGDVVRLWFRLAADALGRTRTAIDMLNVFPVPGADTGTNLHRTIACAADALADLPAHASPADIWQAGTTAALRGACGNSGIIVSQLLRGLADICGPASPCDGQVVATAAVHRPVEGTALPAAPATSAGAAAASPFGYEVTFLLEAAEQAVVALREQLDLLGDSLVVSGREPLLHGHAHVADAAAAIEAGLAAGRPSKVTVTYLNGAQASTPAGWPAPASRIVAVADGPGLRELLRGAGAEVVDCSAGADPAAARDELARSHGPAVLVAPPGRLAQRWPPGWPVIEVGSLVQSLAALAVHAPGGDQHADLAAMRLAADGMRWTAITGPAPDGAGDPASEPLVGRIAGRIVASGPELPAVAAAVIDRLLGPEKELLTLVTGQGTGPGAGRLAADHIAAVAPAVEVVCYDGGMASAVLLIGAE